MNNFVLNDIVKNIGYLQFITTLLFNEKTYSIGIISSFIPYYLF
jgi:hypothetical protein